MAAERFPAYLVCEHWDDATESSLVQDYIDWISPSLLTLQHLTSQQRAQLEKNLYIQAESVEHHWRLYPEVVDDKVLTAARVQYRFLKAK